MAIKIIIAGSREFKNYDLLKKVVGQILSGIKSREIEVVSGTCRGADLLGEAYANENKLAIKRFPANWDAHGKKAGFIRNKEMGKYADMAIIFCVNNSKGSIMMHELMTKEKKKSILISIGSGECE